MTTLSVQAKELLDGMRYSGNKTGCRRVNWKDARVKCYGTPSPYPTSGRRASAPPKKRPRAEHDDVLETWA